MEITIQYTGQLAGIAGCSEERIDLADDAVVSDVVSLVCERHGSGFDDLLLTDGGDLRSTILVILDGEQALGDSSQSSLSGVKTLLLMTPIAGG